MRVGGYALGVALDVSDSVILQERGGAHQRHSRVIARQLQVELDALVHLINNIILVPVAVDEYRLATHHEDGVVDLLVEIFGLDIVADGSGVLLKFQRTVQMGLRRVGTHDRNQHHIDLPAVLHSLHIGRQVLCAGLSGQILPDNALVDDVHRVHGQLHGHWSKTYQNRCPR